MKNILRNEFCGDDYKRALESKLRCTKFTRSTDISTFCPQLRQIIQELYNIVEPDTVELIAVNHIAELEPSLRESVKILQLTGHARLVNVLELIKLKMVSEMSNLSPLSPTFNAAATVPNYVSQQDRFDRLENLVEKLSHQVAILTTNSNTRRQQINITSIYCENCRKPGHVKEPATTGQPPLV